MTTEETAKADLVDLDAFVTEAGKLAEQLISEARFGDDDHLGFMILAYLCKLTEQSNSIQLLVNNGLGRDAELVARSMLECMASLIWAAQDPSDRAFRWRGFAYVEDFKLMEEQRSKGIRIDKNAQNRINDFLKTNASVFQDPKRAGKPNPYFRDWKRGERISKVFTAVGGKPLYVELYGPFSDWIHSGVKSIGEAISRSGKTIQWKPPSPRVDATGLSVAFQSLAESMKLAADHFGSGLADKVDSLMGRFQARFEPTSTAK